MDADTKRLVDQVTLMMQLQKDCLSFGPDRGLLTKSNAQETIVRKLVTELKRGQNLLPFSD